MMRGHVHVLFHVTRTGCLYFIRSVKLTCFAICTLSIVLLWFLCYAFLVSYSVELNIQCSIMHLHIFIIVHVLYIAPCHYKILLSCDGKTIIVMCSAAKQFLCSYTYVPRFSAEDVDFCTYSCSFILCAIILYKSINNVHVLE